jgi:hypothetical protein
MSNRWSIPRFAGLGFIFGSVLSMIRALVQEAGTDLAPGTLFGLVMYGGIGGAVLLGVVATARNFFSR